MKPRRSFNPSLLISMVAGAAWSVAGAQTGWVVGEQPRLAIDHAPTYGTEENISGHIEGTRNYSAYSVAIHIQVSDLWFSKPSAAQPCVEPNVGTGEWWADITASGTCDPYATRVAVWLLPAPADCAASFSLVGAPELPGALGSLALSRLVLERGPAHCPAVSFAGRLWDIKHAPDCAVAPGRMPFDCRNVAADADGLHLTMSRSDGVWRGAEAISRDSIGHGRYVFCARGRLSRLDERAVFGVFTFDPTADWPYRELDAIEVTRWCDSAEETNAQFAVQPAYPSLVRRIALPTGGGVEEFTFVMTWTPRRADFAAYEGRHPDPAGQTPLAEWSVEGGAIPAPGNEKVRFNYYIADCDHDGLSDPDPGGTGAEIVVTDFVFTPFAGRIPVGAGVGQ